MRKERAFLVGLDYRVRKRTLKKAVTSVVQAARDTSTSPKSNNEPQFSAEESLGELRDLALSAGAVPALDWRWRTGLSLATSRDFTLAIDTPERHIEGMRAR